MHFLSWEQCSRRKLFSYRCMFVKAARRQLHSLLESSHLAGISCSARESRLEQRRTKWVQRRAPTEHFERERRAERFRPPVRDEGAQEGVAGALAQRRAAHEDRARHPPENKGAHRCRCPARPLLIFTCQSLELFSSSSSPALL